MGQEERKKHTSENQDDGVEYSVDPLAAQKIESNEEETYRGRSSTGVGRKECAGQGVSARMIEAKRGWESNYCRSEFILSVRLARRAWLGPSFRVRRRWAPRVRYLGINYPIGTTSRFSYAYRRRMPAYNHVYVYVVYRWIVRF